MMGNIDDYLTGRMSQEERDAFEKSVECDAEAQREIDFHKQVNASIGDSDVDELRAKLKSLSRRYVYKNQRAIYFRVVAATVTLLLVVGTVFLNSYTSPREIYSDYFTPFVPPSAARSTLGAQVLNAVEQSFQKGDFSAVVAALNTDSIAQFDYVTSMIYVSSLMELGRFDDAIGVLAQMEQQPSNSLFLSSVRWNRLLCYVGKGDVRKALLLCNELELDNDFRHVSLKKLKRRIWLTTHFSFGH